jgi:uncharacterized protein (DUF924 family)
MQAKDIVGFWRDAGMEQWFAKDAAFDAEVRNRFLPAHEAAASGALDGWTMEAEGALALQILLDQVPRNAFRDSARMFATDAKARALADAALALGHDQAIDPALRLFFYLPFEHSENLADQQRAVALITPLGGELLRYALIHLEVIERFGRFPHRNAVLGRTSTPEELAFLAEGGFSG